MAASARSNSVPSGVLLRRIVAAPLTRHAALGIGLVAMSALTVPAASDFAVALEAVLWVCLGYFALEAVLRSQAALKSAVPRAALVFPVAIDVLGLVPVPAALLAGVAPASGWLFAALWVLKLIQNSPALAQLGRVFVIEAKPLASVLMLFLMMLFLSAAVMHVLEREGQPATFGTLPLALWWAVVTLTTTGYGDAVPHTQLGHLLGAAVMIGGIATFGLWTGILATGFAAESRRQNFIRTWDVVGKVPFFRSLDPAAIAEITQSLRRIDVPERTALIRRGKIGDCMYFIADGEVEVDVEPAPVRLGPGTFFGELALLGDSIRTASVSTTRTTTLLVLDLAEFRTVMAHHPELARIIDAEGKRRLGENLRRREPGGAPL
jgi:voltage-gated potassium channel